MKLRVLAIITSTFLTIGTVSAGPFEDGVAADNRGDYANALSIFRRLAEGGDANAQLRLSMMYGRGRGVSKNSTEEVKWLRSAARKWNAQAQSNLGVAYTKGQGVVQDCVWAYAWFSISAQAGNEAAMTNRNTAEKRMTPKQISDAKKFAMECQQRLWECN